MAKKKLYCVLQKQIIRENGVYSCTYKSEMGK